MPRFLVIDLWGPLCSWGTVAVGDIRPCQPYPTRSAVLGLAAGALGLRRGDHDRQRALAEGLGLAVLVRGSGLPMRDFHTVEIPRQKKGAWYADRREELAGLHPDDNPIVSQRDYRADAAYSAAFWPRAGAAWPGLPELAQALDRPVFTPYLGRKACPPGMPPHPRLVEAPHLLAAFEKADEQVQRPGLGDQWPVGRELFWDADLDHEMVGCRPDGVSSRRDQPGNRLRWLFAERPECWAALP